MRIILYNRNAAVAYARRWALDRNPNFYDFGNVGGDCTNFISQCIYAGDGMMNCTPIMGWYYRSSYDRTASWTGVMHFYNFLVNNKSIGPFGHTVSRWEVEPGDIVQLGTQDGHFYHTPIITSIFPTILVAAHDEDTLDRPLNSYRFERARFLHVDGIRVW